MSGWTPYRFRSVTLAGYYDAEDNTKLTNAGAGACSAWVDSANSANSITQGTAASRPTIVTRHALTGRQVLQFDGTDDYLTSTGACPYAVTGNLSILVVGVQDALGADAVSRYAVTTGVSVTNGLMMRRAQSASANRFTTLTGNGAGGSNSSGSAGGLMDNRFIAVGTWAGTTQAATLNGGTLASNIATMFGDTTRFRVGASAATTPAGFWQGAISAVLYVTGAIDATDHINFHRWALRRLGGGTG